MCWSCKKLRKQNFEPKLWKKLWTVMESWTPKQRRIWRRWIETLGKDEQQFESDVMVFVLEGFKIHFFRGTHKNSLDFCDRRVCGHGACWRWAWRNASWTAGDIPCTGMQQSSEFSVLHHDQCPSFLNQLLVLPEFNQKWGTACTWKSHVLVEKCMNHDTCFGGPDF